MCFWCLWCWLVVRANLEKTVVNYLLLSNRATLENKCSLWRLQYSLPSTSYSWARPLNLAKPHNWCQKWDIAHGKKMTKGGKKNEPLREEPDEGAAASSMDPTAMVGQGDKLEELTEMMKTFMQSQAAREKQQEKEFSRQELRWRNMEHQFRQIQAQVTEMREEQEQEEDEVAEREEETPRPPRPQRDPKLLPLSPEDDIEQFLTTFERMAHVCRWPLDEWAVRLVPLLTGKARSAYVLMDINDSEDYEKVKQAILAKYEITADTYRQRFRALDIHPGETPRELYVRLKDTFGKWAKTDIATVKDIAELMILEQFLRMMNPDVEVWIREHDPKTAEEAARLAEVFQSARRGRRSFSTSQNSFQGPTSSQNVARSILQAASVHLTPVTLELGGKCPCVIYGHVDVTAAAHRLAWAKYFNAGQSCVAPDYILCSPATRDALLPALRQVLEEFYSKEPQTSPDFSRIVTPRHWTRLMELLKRSSGKVVLGGESNQEDKYIAPTVLVDVAEDDALMQEEIFGPILPILTVESLQESIDFINRQEKPLALYVFSDESSVINTVLEKTSSGGFCSNDGILHMSLPSLPFGGVGASGWGSYHGRWGFETFTHRRACMLRGWGLERLNGLRYPPYQDYNLSWLRWSASPKRCSLM